eukprot:g11460.t1
MQTAAQERRGSTRERSDVADLEKQLVQNQLSPLPRNNSWTFGQGVHNLILLDFQPNVLVFLVRMAFMIQVLCSFPLQMLPATRLIELSFFGPPVSDPPFARKLAKSGRSGRVQEGFRAVLVAVFALIAYAGASHLDNFVSLIGALCGVPLAFIFPAAAHYFLIERCCSDLLLMAFGVILTVLVTAVNLAAFLLSALAKVQELMRVEESVPQIDLPHVPMHKQPSDSEPKKVAVVQEALEEVKDEAKEEPGDDKHNPRLLRKSVQPLHDYAELGDEIYDTDSKFEVMQKKTRRFLDSSLFGKLLASVILLNCVSLGWQVDWGVQNYSQPEPVTFEVVTTLFTIVFTFEYGVRCFAFGIYMFNWLLRPYLAGLTSDQELERQDLMNDFGSMVLGIFTLFQAMSGGVDWGEVAVKLMKVSWLLGLLFCVYMAFALFCVLNVMTGVFVENASKMTSADEECCREQNELSK